MISTLWLLAATLAQDVPATPPAPEAISKSEAEQRLAACGTRRFDTSVLTQAGDKVRRAKISLCAKPDDSDAQWIATLEKARAQLEASPQLTDAAKAAVGVEIAAAIAKVREAGLAQAATAAPFIDTTAPVVETGGPASTLGPGRDVASTRRDPLDGIKATVPAFLPTPPAASVAAARARPANAPLQVDLRCADFGETRRTVDCRNVQHNGSIIVTAGESLRGPVTVRFLRRGVERDAVQLGALRAGQTVRARISRNLCANVLTADVQFEVVAAQAGGGTAVRSFGPYVIDCP